MEKKKLLLVAVSVGVFLVIVIGAAILVFTPKNTTPRPSVTTNRPIQPGSAGTASGQFAATPGQGLSAGTIPHEQAQIQPATVDPADMVRNREGYQGLQTPPDTGTASNYYFRGDANQSASVEGNRQDASSLVITVPRPATAAVPDASPTRSTGTATVQPARAVATPPPLQQPPQTPAVARQSAETVRAYDAYWVQTGSFSTKTRAENAREDLASKGITAIIETRDLEGRTYYRVRVGPYTSQNEADYWLNLIKNLNGFEDSQVWKSLAQR